MQDSSERRRETSRVNVTTHVEICGSEPGIPAFEAESVDVSGFGMHLKTAYLPNIGDPLLCRFEGEGREILVEGIVAWRAEQEEGGEFGVQFTGLDSSSVQALKKLCALDEPDAPSEEGEGSGPNGGKVRLHIDGLGAPMKARINEERGQRLQVGSNLEFLRVGRRLEIEDVEGLQRRVAEIDAVGITLDPQSQVPQLVVTLRYEGAETSDEQTPQPATVSRQPSTVHFDTSMGPSSPQREILVSRQAQSSVGESFYSEEPESEAGSDDEVDLIEEQTGGPDEEQLAEKLERMAGRAQQVAAAGGRKAYEVSAVLASRTLSVLRRVELPAIAKLGKKEAPQVRRQTARPPAGHVALDKRGFRRQGAPAAAARPGAKQQPAPKGKRRQRAVIAGAAGLAVSAALLGFSLGGGEDQVAEGSHGGASEVALSASSEIAKAAAAGSGEQKRDSKDGLVADVPLFGATPMATMEPAPLGPPPGEEEEGDLSEEERERRAAMAAVDDLSFDEEGKVTAKPEDVKPWGRGRMHLPTIHKLKLDAPGGALKGDTTPTGFSVVVPGRKVLESPDSIKQRDRRIAGIQVQNADSGATIAFRFRAEVPSYRVRLRDNSVQFLISAPKKE